MIIINNLRANFFAKYSKLVIFDKDGTLVVDPGYVHKISDFDWNPNGLKLLKLASANGACICVVSNQSGIENNFFSRRQSIKFCKHLIRMARKIDVQIKKIIICPHSSTSGLRCNCRKPNIGMFLKLRKYNWARDLDTIMVGNSVTDLAFSNHCGIPYIDVGERDCMVKLKRFLAI